MYLLCKGSRNLLAFPAIRHAATDVHSCMICMLSYICIHGALPLLPPSDFFVGS
jgi:hypothetical protein